MLEQVILSFSAQVNWDVPRSTGWGTFAGGDAPGLSFHTIDWLQRTQIAAIASDTWGIEVRPNEFAGAFQPFIRW